MPPLKQLMCYECPNYYSEVGQQKSRMTRLIIITAVRFLAGKNQIQLVILEFGDLGHQTVSLALYSLRKCSSIKGQQ